VVSAGAAASSFAAAGTAGSGVSTGADPLALAVLSAPNSGADGVEGLTGLPVIEESAGWAPLDGCGGRPHSGIAEIGEAAAGGAGGLGAAAGMEAIGGAARIGCPGAVTGGAGAAGGVPLNALVPGIACTIFSKLCKTLMLKRRRFGLPRVSASGCSTGGTMPGWASGPAMPGPIGGT
jgi:hypothetical protein